MAGVRLFENQKARLMAIKFEDKPNQDVRDRMKDAGYRWNSRDMVWIHPIEDANLGAPWIPASDIQAFASELFKVDPSSVPVTNAQDYQTCSLSHLTGDRGQFCGSAEQLTNFAGGPTIPAPTTVLRLLMKAGGSNRTSS